MKERRQRPLAEPLGYIDRLPSRILLNRLPVPLWAVGHTQVIYANRAFEEMLGRPIDSLSGAIAVDLIDGETEEGTSMAAVLREWAGELLGLRHADGSIVKVIVSPSLLIRREDPVVLTGVQDVTQHLWEEGN